MQIVYKNDTYGTYHLAEVGKKSIPPLSKTGVFRTNSVAVPKRPLYVPPKGMKNCSCIDWLQLHVRMPFRDYAAIVKPIKYRIEQQQTQTRNFKSLYSIYDLVTNDEVAVIACEPRSVMCMNEDSGLIKITNKYLYQKNFSDFVRDLLKELQLCFINITRIDLAYDFMRFDTMECRVFIERFAQRDYLKAHQCKFKMMGDTWSVDKGKLTGGVSSLKFGLETSDVSYYLYNKTLELAQVKHKPWIHDHWAANGWKGDCDIYRLEFSLRPDTKGIAIVDKDGEIQQVYHFKELTMLDHIDDIYRHYFNRHFNFVEAELTKKGNYKKQSRCQAVTLFHVLRFESVKISLSNKKDSGRSSKIFAKNLMKLNQELRGQDFDLAIYGNDLMTWIIKTRALEDWANKKLPGHHLSDRVIGLLGQSQAAKLQVELMKLNDMPVIFPSAAEQEQRIVREQESKRIEALRAANMLNHAFDSNGNDLGVIDLPF